jgi:hypothetical protein
MTPLILRIGDIFRPVQPIACDVDHRYLWRSHFRRLGAIQEQSAMMYERQHMKKELNRRRGGASETNFVNSPSLFLAPANPL